MEKVTIIVSVYNSEKYLHKLIVSAINQTWHNLQILLIDDGSKDNSAEICDYYANIDERVEVIHKNNTGVCDSRNVGLKVAKGEYVCFVDGDDWLSADYIEYLMKLIHTTNTRMALSTNLFTTRDQNQIANDEIEIWDSEEAIANIIYPYMVLGPWNKIYSMDLIRTNNIQFPPHWFGETLHFASEVAYYAGAVGVGRRKVYNYRLNNSSSGVTVHSVQNGFDALDNVLTLESKDYISSKKVLTAVKWHIWKNYSFLLMQIIGSKQKKEYLEEYKDSIRYIRRNMMSVLFKSKVTVKEKIKILICGLMPVVYTNVVIRKRRIELAKDKTK